MNSYVTGNLIKKLREEKKLTQQQLADKLFISPKTISKWETGKGLPDISLYEKISEILNVSIRELFSGEKVTNLNTNFNMQNIKFYVCPICHNIIVSIGENIVSCHGINLPILDAQEITNLSIEKVEDEYYISIPHSMKKDDYILFVCGVYSDSYKLVKLYPENNAEIYLKIANLKSVYFYDIKNGLFKYKIAK